MLLERDQELSDLTTFVGDAHGHGGGVVLVAGEAGIGKTSLVRALLDTTAVDTLVGGCEPLNTPVPLQPLHDIAHQVGGRLAALMASDVDRHQRFSALLEVLGNRPTLAVVEDVHWADDATLDLLVFLGRRLAGTPSVLLVTVRDPSNEAPPRLVQVLALLGSARRSLRVTPAPLSAAAVTSLAAGRPVDAARVVALTDGNPFFVTEVLAAAGSAVPASVRDAVLGRAVELGPGARGMLEAAAVVPDRVELDLLRSVSPGTAEDLEACERAGLLVVGSRTVAYRHELARVAVLESIPVTRQQAWHAAVVAHLVTRPGHREARIAHHADLAGDSRTVLDNAVPAAEQAARLGSHREAGAQLDRALAHLEIAGADEAAAILSRAAVVRMSTGQLAEAFDASTQALALHRDSGEVDGLAVQLALQSRILWATGRSDEAKAAAAEAVAVAGERPGSRAEMTALSYASLMHMLAREVPEALQTGGRAIELARRHGDTEALARSLNAVGTASWFGDPDAAEPLLVESLETGRRGRDDLAVAGAMINLGSGAGEIRRYGTARRWLRECIDFCRTRDLDFNLAYATAWLSRVELETGEWNQAQRLATDVRTTPSPIALLTALTVAGRIACRRGEAAGREQLDRAWEIATRTGDLQRTWPVAAGKAEAAWLGGRAEEVQQLVGPVLDEAVRLDQPWAIGELGWWWTRTGGSHPAPDRAASPYALLEDGDWRAAARAWDHLGCPYDAALARAEGDDPDELAAASAALHRLGARTDAARVAQRMRSLGLQAATRPRRATATNPAGLTDRELEVARLLSTGATNNDIATALFISPRTAAHHVSAVLAKLGVRTRREAGPALAEHGHR